MGSSDVDIDRLSVYWSGVQPPPPPATVPNVGLWESLGCYRYVRSISEVAPTDLHHPLSDGNTRTLPVQVNTAGPNTIESCTDACFNAGYPLAGAEFSTQCFCGLNFTAGSGPTPLSDCNMACAGNSSEFCGGPDRLNVRLPFYMTDVCSPPTPRCTTLPEHCRMVPYLRLAEVATEYQSSTSILGCLNPGRMPLVICKYSKL
jgi:hypothetical protein